MSFHVAPPLAGRPTPASAGEILNLSATGETIATEPYEIAPPAPEVLAVNLDRMGVVLALSATQGFSRGLDVRPAEDGTIHINVAADGIASCMALFSDAAPAGVKLRAMRDPVVERLSRALTGVEEQQGDGGLYADAVRLAIVTRILSLRSRPETEPDREPATAPTPAPQKTGLPKWRMKRVVAYIDENLAAGVTLAGMAEAAGLSRMHFAAQFRITTGLRPHEFLLRRRIERAQEMMIRTRESLVQVALAVGFQTQAHFTTVFRRFVDDTPYQWRCAQGARA